jgi:hypothetical protein
MAASLGERDGKINPADGFRLQLGVMVAIECAPVVLTEAGVPASTAVFSRNYFTKLRAL